MREFLDSGCSHGDDADSGSEPSADGDASLSAEPDLCAVACTAAAIG
jgi:hypothetical protein